MLQVAICPCLLSESLTRKKLFVKEFMASERRFVSKATFSFKRYTNNIPIINFYGWIIIILICQCVACVYPFSFTSRNLTLSLTFVFYDPSLIEEWLFGNNCYINCTRHSSYMFIFFACIERGSFCLEIHRNTAVVPFNNIVVVHL